jgi:hypothetical protein
LGDVVLRYGVHRRVAGRAGTDFISAPHISQCVKFDTVERGSEAEFDDKGLQTLERFAL